MKITLEQLNEKWWYRFIKVIWVLVILFASIAFVWEIFNARTYPNMYKSYAECASGKTIGLHKAGIFRDWEPVRDSDQDVNLRYFCINQGTEFVSLSSEYMSFTEKQDLLKNAPSINYEIKHVSDYGVFLAVIYSVLAVLGTLLFQELIRRIFYYIILGKFFPERR